MLERVAAAVPQAGRKLIECFWPGPLTLVLPARENLPRPLVNAAGGIGVRISSEPIATELVRALGRPLTATSANPSGKNPARTLEEARTYFGRRIEAFVDGGTLDLKIASTVVEVAGEQAWIIRHGAIATADLESVLGRGHVASRD
jgi:L-threonylcarbamoyladenylate synthase